MSTLSLVAFAVLSGLVIWGGAWLVGFAAPPLFDTFPEDAPEPTQDEFDNPE
jgi:hypothetical protein